MSRWGDASTIRNCFSTGSVRAEQRVGGFCGGLIKSETKIINCYSTCEPSALRGAGGIVGFANLDKGSGNETNVSPGSRAFIRGPMTAPCPATITILPPPS